MAQKTHFQKLLERIIGHSIEEIQQTPIDEFRDNLEKKKKRKIGFKSYYPKVGRGNIFLARNRIITRDELNKSLDEKFAQANEQMDKVVK